MDDPKPIVADRFSFDQKLAEKGLLLAPLSLDTLQLNITRLCNQACEHCHVDASPRRREMMSKAVVDRCLRILEDHPGITTLDITGGAPELHPDFREMVIRARQLGRHVIVRHNLTVTLDPHPLTKESLRYLPEFFADQGVEVVSSLPCYQELRTDQQRGDGVFQKSIQSLGLLNELGFGREGSPLVLNLVYNPVGAFLPPAQDLLEGDYKRELRDNFGIEFTKLFALTNMPIHRFKAQLRRLKSYEDYMETLVSTFNDKAASGVMCRSMISVAAGGGLYDCDFNQMLGMAIGGEQAPLTVFDFDAQSLLSRRIRFASHCFGCTAGMGASCRGTIS